jgi:hypothetical protein
MGGHFIQSPDPVGQVVQPMMASMFVGLGGDATSANAPHADVIDATHQTTQDPA